MTDRLSWKACEDKKEMVVLIQTRSTKSETIFKFKILNQKPF